VDSPDTDRYIERALELSRERGDPELHLYNLLHVSVYQIWAGATAEVNANLPEIETLSRSPQVSKLSRLLALTPRAYVHFIDGDPAGCHALISEGLELARAWGLQAPIAPLLWLGLDAALSDGDAARSAVLLREYDAHLPPGATKRA